MENKKLKLNKENLDAISIMQHMVFISKSTYDCMKNKDFMKEEVINDFDLLCESYLRLHESHSIYMWQSHYNNLLPKTVKYTVQSSEKSPIFHLIIDLTKEYDNCAKVGIQTQTLDRMIEPVSINIFNVKFEKEIN